MQAHLFTGLLTQKVGEIVHQVEAERRREETEENSDSILRGETSIGDPEGPYYSGRQLFQLEQGLRSLSHVDNDESKRLSAQVPSS